MADVFVSYSSQDRERVVPLVEAIERRGWSVWWDREIDVGKAFDRAIEKAIDEAKCIIVVWSASSIESDWVRNEATEGLERGVLVPVAVDAIRPPLAFRRTQTIDLTDAQPSLESVMDAITSFAPVGSREGGEISPCVGRDAEIGELRRLLRRGCEGHGGLVLLYGEAGVGKTRLTKETGAMARDEGMLTLTGHCLDMDGAPPYQPLIEQIEEASRLVEPNDLRAALGENAPEVAKLMPELHQLFPDIDSPISLPPDQERRYLLHGVGEFIARAAGAQPMLLLFEDLHWADESTCVLLQHLALRLRDAPVVMLGTYRDTDLDTRRPLARTLEALTRERLVDEVRLKRLDEHAVAALLEGRAGQSPPDALVSLIFSETEGNPFFIEEVYRHLDESEKLFDEDGCFTTDVNIADNEVPRSVRLVIEQRLTKISEATRRLLTLAAVAGRVVSFELLSRIGELEDETLFDALEEAEAASLIEDVTQGREVRYRFVHEQIRQTLLGVLSLPRRQRVHLRIAGAIEAHLGTKADGNPGEIAYHLYQAGAGADADRTAHFLLLASQRALDALAFEDALKQIDMVLEVIGHDDEAMLARTQSMRALALCGCARTDEALDVLAEGIALGNAVDGFGDLLLQRSRLLVALYRGAEALPHLQQLLDIARSISNSSLELTAQQVLSDAYYTLSLDQPDYAQQAKQACERTMELARAEGNQRALATALIASSHFVDYWVDYRTQASRNLSEALAIGEALGDEDILLDCQSMGLRTSIFTPVEYELRAEQICKRLEERRDPIRLKEHLFWMIGPARDAGRLERSVEVCEQAIELADRLNVEPVQYPTFKALGLVGLGRFGDAWQSIEQEVADESHRFGAALQRYGFFYVQAACGAIDDVLADARPLIEECNALNRAWMVNGLSDILATAAARAGRPADATTILDDLANIGTSCGPAAQAELALAQGDLESALDQAKHYRDERTGAGMALRAIDAAELMMRALLKLSRFDEVLPLAEEAIEFCERTNYRALGWRALADRAVARVALGDEVGAQADRAHAVAAFDDVCAHMPSAHLRQTYQAHPFAKTLLETTGG